MARDSKPEEQSYQIYFRNNRDTKVHFGLEIDGMDFYIYPDETWKVRWSQYINNLVGFETDLFKDGLYHVLWTSTVLAAVYVDDDLIYGVEKDTSKVQSNTTNNSENEKPLFKFELINSADKEMDFWIEPDGANITIPPKTTYNLIFPQSIKNELTISFDEDAHWIIWTVNQTFVYHKNELIYPIL